ncbi:MAG: hypothetical protein IT240_02765, partial [Bacteroidia bacterium]|nr:hypothetical protein [Bacteroidia bacterium]
DHTLNQKVLADALYQESKKAGLSFYRVPLKAKGPDKGLPTDEKWKIIINTEIEVDE